MSEVLAGTSTPNKGQVAANIVQGVGFLGAGLILHTRNRVLGLTTAATVFVVAAIGMTCGAGIYVGAVIATMLVLIALLAVGFMESRLGWKRYSMLYEVRAQVGSTLDREIIGEERADALARRIESARLRMLAAILQVMDAAGQRLQVLDRDNIAGLERVCFAVIATRRMHEQVLERLKASDATDQVVSFPDAEAE
jgi:putative Mg2+ transporter-C (MgtC) family protein